MHFLKNLSVSVKMAAFSAAVLVAALGAVVALSSFNAFEAARNAGISRAQDEVALTAAEVTGFVQEAFTVSHMFAEAAQEAAAAAGSANGAVDRTALMGLYRAALERHGEWFGTWAVMLPEALDGEDSAWKGQPGHDRAGIFTPYWVRDGDRIVQDTNDPAYDVSAEYAEAYFTVPRETGKPALIEPYTEELNDAAKTQVMMTSAVVPISAGGTFAGVAGVDLNLVRLQQLAETKTPLGSGRVWLVSEAGNIVAHPDSSLLNQPMEEAGVPDQAVREALNGKAPIVTVNGAAQLIASQRVVFDGVDQSWTLVSAIPMETVLADARSARNTLLLTGFVILVLAVGAAVVVGRTVGQPILGLARSMTDIADGRLDADIPFRGQTNEIGRMAGALDYFRIKTEEARKLEAEAKEAEHRMIEERRAAARQMADDFESRAGSLVRSVADSVDTLRSSAANLDRLASEGGTLSEAAARGAEDVTQNVSVVASAAEELLASIQEISQQISQANRISADAAEDARSASQQMNGLAAQAQRIGEVVTLIQDIAEQTNLLALNATIEAARAGDAGKGFAVVASEVKGLATQTARATEDISGQVQAIQTEVQGAVERMTRIDSVVSEIREVSGAIAAAVEEQSAATGEIAASANTASDGVASFARHVQDVSGAMTSLNQLSSGVLGSADQLKGDSGEMEERIGTFLNEVRASS